MFINEENTNEEVVVEETTTEEATPVVEEVVAEAAVEETPAAEETVEEANKADDIEASAKAEELAEGITGQPADKPVNKDHVPTKWDIHPNPFNQQGFKRFSRDNFEERVVQIRRVVKTVKGGKNFKFSALVVVGDKEGKVGYGSGKSKEVPEAIKKAIKDAKKNIFNVSIVGESSTLSHEVIGKHDAARVMLKPAKEGTGVIASDVVRAVVELAGIRNIYTKNLSTNNPQNVVKAVINGLTSAKLASEYARLRDIDVSELTGGKK